MQQKSFHSFIKKLSVFLIIFLSSIFITTLQSCEKAIIDHPPVSRGSLIISSVWGLTSATSIDSLSSGSRITYKAIPSDSLIVLWEINPNVQIYGINSFLSQVNTQYYINRIGECSTAHGNDTTTIASDTFMLATPWKQGYSDTLFITKTSPTQLVFNVRYTLPTGNGVEVDSFHVARYF